MENSMRSDFDLDGRPGGALALYALEGHDRDDRWAVAAMLDGQRLWPRAPAIVRVAKRFRVSPERVFAAWLDAKSAGRWLFATATQPIAEVDIDARVGGAFRLLERRRRSSTEYAGRYLHILPSRELALLQQPVARLERRPTAERWSGILYGLDLVLEAETRNDPRRS
jgi:activator of Hsp90 ATPase-like protein